MFTLRAVTVRIDLLVEKNLPVEAALTGASGQYFVVGNVVIHPDLMQVKGPKRAAEALTYIRPKPVAIGALSESLHRCFCPKRRLNHYAFGH